MEKISIRIPTNLWSIYVKLYRGKTLVLLLVCVVFSIILKTLIVFYVFPCFAVFLLFTGGDGGLESYPFGFVIENEQKRIVIHYFKVPFIKKKKEFLFEDIAFEYALPQKYAHYKNDDPWLLIYHRGVLVFYINQRNIVGWSREEILSIYNRLTTVVQE